MEPKLTFHATEPNVAVRVTRPTAAGSEQGRCAARSAENVARLRHEQQGSVALRTKTSWFRHKQQLLTPSKITTIGSFANADMCFRREQKPLAYKLGVRRLAS